MPHGDAASARMNCDAFRASSAGGARPEPGQREREREGVAVSELVQSHQLRTPLGSPGAKGTQCQADGDGGDRQVGDPGIGMGNQVLREDQVRDPTQQTPEENITGCSKRRMDRPSIALDRVGPNFNQDLEYELDDELEEKFCKNDKDASSAA